MAVSPATGPTEHEIKNNAEHKTTLAWKRQFQEMEPKIDELMQSRVFLYCTARKIIVYMKMNIVLDPLIQDINDQGI